MTDVIVAAAKGLARGWVTEASNRRKISRSDPVAEALEYCAGELEARLKAVEHDNRLSVEQYAKLPHVDVTPQTVRYWIRSGQLQAVDTPKGYRISADAKRLKRSA